MNSKLNEPSICMQIIIERRASSRRVIFPNFRSLSHKVQLGWLRLVEYKRLLILKYDRLILKQPRSPSALLYRPRLRSIIRRDAIRGTFPFQSLLFVFYDPLRGCRVYQTVFGLILQTSLIINKVATFTD